MTTAAITSLRSMIDPFWTEVARGTAEIYNEFSLQHELGLFLRRTLKGGLRVQFERPREYFGITERLTKREIDIVVFDAASGRRLAIELKFPRNGQHPEQMFKVCQDIRFLEELGEQGFEGGLMIFVADDPLFYSGRAEGIYRCFRSAAPLCGPVTKPTGKRDELVQLRGTYRIEWRPIAGALMYAAVEVNAEPREDDGAI